MSEWQPIETAPRDGSPFLTYSPPEDWVVDEDCYDVAVWSERWGKFAKQGCGFNAVTHWSPLEPPK
jgi:hypothetical protein